MSESLASSRPELLARPLPVGSAWLAHLSTERDRLAPWLAVGLGGGVLAYFTLDEEPTAAAILPALPLLALAVWTGLRRPVLGWLLGMVAAVALGFAAAAWHSARQPPMPDLPRGGPPWSPRMSPRWNCCRRASG